MINKKKKKEIRPFILPYKKILFVCLLSFTCTFVNAQRRPGFEGRYNFITLEKDIFWTTFLASLEPSPIKRFISPTIKYERIMNRRIILGLSFNTAKFTFEDNASSPYRPYGGNQLQVGNSLIYPVEMYGKYNLTTRTYGLSYKKYHIGSGFLPYGGFRMWDVFLCKGNISVPAGYGFKDEKSFEYVSTKAWEYKFTQLAIGLNFGKTRKLYKDKMLWNISAGACLKVKLNGINNMLYDHFLESVASHLSYNQFFNIKMGISYAL